MVLKCTLMRKTAKRSEQHAFSSEGYTFFTILERDILKRGQFEVGCGWNWLNLVGESIDLLRLCRMSPDFYLIIWVWINNQTGPPKRMVFPLVTGDLIFSESENHHWNAMKHFSWAISKTVKFIQFPGRLRRNMTFKMWVILTRTFWPAAAAASLRASLEEVMKVYRIPSTASPDLFLGLWAAERCRNW